MVRNYVRKKPEPAYSQETLKHTIDNVKSNQMTLYRASEHYTGPKALFKRVKGMRGVKSNSGGRPTVMSY